MINRPELENLIQELKKLQLDQARIQSRQTDTINLLETAYQGSAEDNRQAPRTQGAEQDTAPQAATGALQTSSPTWRDKCSSAIKVGDKVQIPSQV